MVGKGEIARNEQFLHCFLPFGYLSAIFVTIYNCHLQTQTLHLLCGKGLTHSHTMAPFDAPGKQAF